MFGKRGSAAACLFVLVCAAGMMQGCAPGDRPRTVTIDLYTPDHQRQVVPSDFMPYSAFVNSDAARKANAATYEIETTGRAFMSVAIVSPDEGGPSSSNPKFMFLLDPREKHLSFKGESGLLSVNGRPTALDLSLQKEGGFGWLAKASAKDLRSLRGLTLSGDVVADLMALKAIKSLKDAFCDLSEYKKDLPADVVEALARANPAGLSVNDVPGRDELLSRLKAMRFLITDGSVAGLTPVLHRLEMLCLDKTPLLPNRSGQPSLDFLAGAKRLRFLAVGDVGRYGPAPASNPASPSSEPATQEFEPARMIDVGALSSLPHLQVLILNWQGHKDLRPLEPLENLRELDLFECGSLQNLAGVQGLRNLRTIAILKMPERLGGITDLKDLPHLKLVIFDNEFLKKGAQQAQIDELKRARPDIRVEGFCMGSWLILLIVPAALAGGLVLRRARRLPAGALQ